MKLTFGNVKAACAKVLCMNSSDPRVMDVVNRGCERLLYDAGKSVDTVARYTVCLTDGCVTWPRELETIEAWEKCGGAGTVRNGWYEFLAYGPGGMSSGNGSSDQLRDRGNSVAFDDVVGTGKKLAVYADGTEDDGAFMLVRYYDGNANKVYTTVGSDVIEGERIPIPNPAVDVPPYSFSASEIMAGGLYEVIKPVTKKPIRLYEYDTVALTYRALAYYEPDETLPTYRRSLIPCLAGSSTGGCTTQRVTVMAKRRFIPATGDDSVLIISHADAVRLACQAIKKEEDVGIAEAEPMWQMAIRCLDRQLRHYQGDGVAVPINFAGMDSPVCNLV
jgi:hypothetical protein